MGKQQMKVTQDWVRHFDAPAALMRVSAASGHTVAVDEDGRLHLIDPAGAVLLSKAISWMPAAVALDEDARVIGLLSPGGILFLLDRTGRMLSQLRVGLRPLYLDLAPAGDKAAFVDGNGSVGVVDFQTGKTEMRDEKGPFSYVKFLASGAQMLACGQYGQVLFVSAEGDTWQKDFRCHTRVPAASRGGELILLPSPHYGIIALKGDGAQVGLLDVPGGPKGAAVTADGHTILTVNEKNELLIFDAGGTIYFRQPLGAGVAYFECDAAGQRLTAMMTSGSIERFSVNAAGAGEGQYIEFAEPAADASEGPAVLWQAKVFSQLGGLKGGQLAVTRGARHVALLDATSRLRVFDQAGNVVSEEQRIEGRQPQVKACRTQDFLVAASSDALLALDMRSFRQRRLALRNEWTTHFDISPTGIFFSVADFFRGVSLFDETLNRFAYLETEDDVHDVAVDGARHTMIALSRGNLAFYDEKGVVIAQLPYPASQATAVCGLGQGFAAAAKGKVDAFTTSGVNAWSVDAPGEVIALSPLRAGLVAVTADGISYVFDGRGYVTAKLMRRATARFFSSQDKPGEVISVEYRGQLITARSSSSGVLWRREMPDDVIGLEISPGGGFAMALSGVYLYALSTASGEEAPQERLYLEI